VKKFQNFLIVIIFQQVPIISPLELARQLTLVENEIFCLLKPREFFNCAWNSKRKEALAGNVALLTSRFNQFASWMASLVKQKQTQRKYFLFNFVSKKILNEKSASDRGHLISYFIEVQRGEKK
jgi:hypothetical protein